MKKIRNSQLMFCLILLFFVVETAKANKNLQEEIFWTQPFRQCWSNLTNKITGSIIASDNELIFLATLDGNIEAINSANGATLWNSQLGGEIVSITKSDKEIIVISKVKDSIQNPINTIGNTNLSSVHSIDQSTGITNWKITSKQDETPLVNSDAGFILTTTESGRLTALNSKDGLNFWKSDVNQKISTLLQNKDVIVFGLASKEILLVSAISGVTIVKISTPEIPTSIFAIDEETVYWGDGQGTLYASNRTTNKINWKIRFGASISSLSYASGAFLVTSLDNFVYMITKGSGKTLWKRRLPARVIEKPLVVDDIAIVTVFGDSTVLFFELKKGKIVNSFTLSDANYFTGSPVYINNLLVFPTLKGLYAYSNNCPQKQKTGN